MSIHHIKLNTNKFKYLFNISLIFLLIFYAIPSKASLEATELVQKILSDDFNGNDMGRYDRVIYLNGKTASPEDCPDSRFDGRCSGTRSESYSLESDAVIIVSSWKLIDEPEILTDNSLKYRVLFHTIAMPEGYGVPSWMADKGREFRLTSPPKDDEVIYRVKKIAGIWKVINPPVPRIGIDTMLNFLRSDLNHFSSPTLAEKWKKSGVNAQKNLDIINAWLSRQISVLTSANH